MAYGTNTSGNAGQVAIDRFAEMMIARMEQMKASDWKKGWIGGASGFAGLPQNVGGRNYSGSNSFFLQLQTAAQGYRLPVYLTFKQGQEGVLTGTEYLICKQVIRDHDEFAGRRGCRINAQPAAEGGFTVWFTLPAR